MKKPEGKPETLEQFRKMARAKTAHVAHFYGLTADALSRLCLRGEIPGAMRTGRDWYVTPAGMDKYMTPEYQKRIRSHRRIDTATYGGPVPKKRDALGRILPDDPNSPKQIQREAEREAKKGTLNGLIEELEALRRKHGGNVRVVWGDVDDSFTMDFTHIAADPSTGFETALIFATGTRPAATAA